MSERPYLNTAEAMTYLGFHTPGAIRHCVYRGELVPDGVGPRGSYVFLRATLDAFVRARLEKRHGVRARSGEARSEQVEDPRPGAGPEDRGEDRSDGDGDGDEGGGGGAARRAPRRVARRRSEEGPRPTETIREWLDRRAGKPPQAKRRVQVRQQPRPAHPARSR